MDMSRMDRRKPNHVRSLHAMLKQTSIPGSRRRRVRYVPTLLILRDMYLVEAISRHAILGYTT